MGDIMKNRKKGIIFSVGASILIVSALVVSVFAAQPGSEDDPIVSKSYVDSRIDELLNAIENNEPIVINPSDNSENGSDSEVVSGGNSDQYRYVPVHVGVSQKIIGGEGTEIILRVGRGFAYVPGNEGIVDATSGKNLDNNIEIEKNHIIIVPRSDGRGIRIVEDAWFIVKGAYTVAEA